MAARVGRAFGLHHSPNPGIPSARKADIVCPHGLTAAALTALWFGCRALPAARPETVKLTHLAVDTWRQRAADAHAQVRRNVTTLHPPGRRPQRCQQGGQPGPAIDTAAACTTHTADDLLPWTGRVLAQEAGLSVQTPILVPMMCWGTPVARSLVVLFALAAVGLGVVTPVADLDTSTQPATVSSAAGSPIVAALSSHMLLRPSASSSAQPRPLP